MDLGRNLQLTLRVKIRELPDLKYVQARNRIYPEHHKRVVIGFLSTVFARKEFPHKLVTDNGTQLTFEEMAAFLKSNRIKHYTSSLYYARAMALF